MKKILLAFAMTAMAVQSVSAQTVEDSKFLDNWYVGANVGYTVSNVTFKANLQYTGTETDTGNFGDLSEGAIKATGFSITPSIGVTF